MELLARIFWILGSDRAPQCCQQNLSPHLFITLGEEPEGTDGWRKWGREKTDVFSQREGCLGLVPSRSPMRLRVLFISFPFSGLVLPGQASALRFTGNPGVLAYSYLICMTSASGARNLWLRLRLEVPRPVPHPPPRSSRKLCPLKGP